MKSFIFSFSPNVFREIKTRRIRWAAHIVRTEDMRYAYKILVRKPERKKKLGRLRRRLDF